MAATMTLSSQENTTTVPTVEHDTQLPNIEDISEPALVSQASPPVPTTADPEVPSASTDAGAVEGQSDLGVLIDDTVKRVDEVSAEAPVSVGGKAEQQTSAPEPDNQKNETTALLPVEEVKIDNKVPQSATANGLSDQDEDVMELPHASPEVTVSEGEEDEAVTAQDEDERREDSAEVIDTTTSHDDDQNAQYRMEAAPENEEEVKDVGPRKVEEDVESAAPEESRVDEDDQEVEENARSPGTVFIDLLPATSPTSVTVKPPENDASHSLGDGAVGTAESESPVAPNLSKGDYTDAANLDVPPTETALSAANVSVEIVTETETEDTPLDHTIDQTMGDQAEHAVQDSSAHNEPAVDMQWDATPTLDLDPRDPDETLIDIEIPEQTPGELTTISAQDDSVVSVSVVDTETQGDNLDVTMEWTLGNQPDGQDAEPQDVTQTGPMQTPTFEPEESDQTAVEIEVPEQGPDAPAVSGTESAESRRESVKLEIPSSGSASETATPLQTPVADLAITASAKFIDEPAVPNDAAPLPYDDVPLPLSTPGSQTAAADGLAGPAEEKATGDAGASAFADAADRDAETNRSNDSDLPDLPESTRRAQDDTAVVLPIQSLSSLIAFTGFGLPPPTSTFNTPLGVSTGFAFNVPVIPQFGNGTFDFNFSVPKDMTSPPAPPLRTPRFASEFTYRMQEDLLSVQNALIEYEVFSHTPQRDVLVLPPIPQVEYQTFYQPQNKKAKKAWRNVPTTAAFGPSLSEALRGLLASGSGEPPATLAINVPTRPVAVGPSSDAVRLRLIAEGEQKLTFSATRVKGTDEPSSTTREEYTTFVTRTSLPLHDVRILELHGAYFGPIQLYRLAVHMPHIAEIYLHGLAEPDLSTHLLTLNSALLFQQLRIVRHDPDMEDENHRITAFWKCRSSLAALFDSERKKGKRVPHIEFDKERITVSNQKLTPDQLAAVDDDDPQMRPYRDALSFYSS